MTNTIGIKVTTVAPFNYGHLAVSGGVATIAEFINDKAICFSLCASLGMLSPSPFPPEKDHLRDMRRIPWRASMLRTENPALLSPIARRSDLGIEGGYQVNIRRASASGNFKEYFSIQEVPPGQEFEGILVGEDPFEIAGMDEFSIRIGSNRTGIARIRKCDTPESVTVNVATGALFGRKIPVDRFILNEMLASPEMTATDAAVEMSKWH